MLQHNAHRKRRPDHLSQGRPSKSHHGEFPLRQGDPLSQTVRQPERILTPLLRNGDRFDPISWDEALDTAAEKLTKIRSESGPLSTLWAQYSGSLSLMNLIMPRMFWIHFGGSTMTRGASPSTPFRRHRSMTSGPVFYTNPRISRTPAVLWSGAEILP